MTVNLRRKLAKVTIEVSGVTYNLEGEVAQGVIVQFETNQPFIKFRNDAGQTIVVDKDSNCVCQMTYIYEDAPDIEVEGCRPLDCANLEQPEVPTP